MATHALALGASNLAYLAEKERSKEWASRALTIEPDDPMNLSLSETLYGWLAGRIG